MTQVPPGKATLAFLRKRYYIYKLSIKNLTDLPKHCVKELFWKEFVLSRIL